MIEIFFGNRIVYLTDEEQPYYAHYKNREQLKDLIHKFEEGNYKELYITYKDLNELFQVFKSIFIFERTAGGLVINEFKQVLAIKNRGIWQLPKGHVEEGETIYEAAMREVAEECNITDTIIVKELPSTFHTYKRDDKFYLKQTFWFKMLYRGSEKPEPLYKEGISEAVWVNRSELDDIRCNTYQNLIQVWDSI